LVWSAGLKNRNGCCRLFLDDHVDAHGPSSSTPWAADGAGNMVKNGFEVSGYDIDAEAAKKQPAMGAHLRIGGRSRKNAEVVMVHGVPTTSRFTTWSNVRLLDTLAARSVLCIASSCSPGTCQKTCQARRPQGISVVDVPPGAGPGGHE